VTVLPGAWFTGSSLVGVLTLTGWIGAVDSDLPVLHSFTTAEATLMPVNVGTLI
jgi:hypothetical protein